MNHSVAPWQASKQHPCELETFVTVAPWQASKSCKSCSRDLSSYLNANGATYRQFSARSFVVVHIGEVGSMHILVCGALVVLVL